ncbi:terminase small subunit [Bacillus sp. CH30_1T]|uniref:terminase small subunit n=1 Tax=Bacillus sp. CH30_1T TaxID=2604836 RepID=UPI0011EEC3EE|nr:terminase small subunit [Bacillus sp. CH30_1T]KAA0565329.1 terminase small subunit [Bacillus sp. CH30_1T]
MPRAEKSKRDELTFQQRKFVNEYLKHGIGRNACISAGYSEKSADSMASQLLKLPKIKKAIEAKEKEFEMAAIITKEKILSEILNIAEDKEATRSEKLNALKLLGQHLAMFTDKQIVQTEKGNPFENLSDEEIMKMAEESQRFKKQG